MCSICGWLEFNLKFHPDNKMAAAEHMNATLAYRGLDDAGVMTYDNAAIAMSHLSIIAFTTGHQPIANEAEACWIICNGEIYNFPDLHRELEARGCRFRTRSDTEVILHAYEEWGPDCVRRLRRMFAFAIYDCRPQATDYSGQPSAVGGCLSLARNRVGKKPLYYHYDAERLIFGSEIKAILAHPHAPRRLDRRIIPLYLAYGYVPTPSTMSEDIYELPPGPTRIVQDKQVTVQQYWDVTYPSVSDPRFSAQACIEQLRELLEESVRIRLISDVPLGAFLSGGLYSSAIVALVARIVDQPVKTLAIGFEDDPSFNELEYARLPARTYGTDHHEYVVRPDAVDLLPKLVWHYDRPIADSSAIPTCLVSKVTRELVSVALTGEGRDELFAGYERSAAARLAEAHRRLPRFMQAALVHLLHALPESTSYDSFVRRARRFVENAPVPLVQRYLGWVGIFNDGFIRELLADNTDVDPACHFKTYFGEVQDVDAIGQLLYVNTKPYLASDLLVKTDRMTMANSMEARCPFLDQELLEFAARIRSDLKLKELTTKHVLRRALKVLVPQDIIQHKKHGFSVSVGHWFRTILNDYVREVLLSPQALRRGYFSEKALRRLVEEHRNGKRAHSHRLWALMTFEIWHRVFIEQEITP